MTSPLICLLPKCTLCSSIMYSDESVSIFLEVKITINLHKNLNLVLFFFYLFVFLCHSQLLSCFISGVNCSEVVGKENCDRICENGSCVQVSPTSFRCICDTGVSGKKLFCISLLVKYEWFSRHCDNEGYHIVLIPDRGMMHSQSVFPIALHQRWRDIVDFNTSPFRMRNHVLCLKGAAIFGKGQTWKLQKPYILKRSALPYGFETCFYFMSYLSS